MGIQQLIKPTKIPALEAYILVRKDTQVRNLIKKKKYGVILSVGEKRGGAGGILNQVVRVDLTERVTVRGRLETVKEAAARIPGGRALGPR